MAQRLSELLGRPVALKSDWVDGVEVAPGEVVLLSPACASYDQFRDYEMRGTHFRQMVGVITGCDPCGDTASRSILP